MDVALIVMGIATKWPAGRYLAWFGDQGSGVNATRVAELEVFLTFS